VINGRFEPVSVVEMRNALLPTLAVFIVAGMITPALAEDRALLVGVGEYRNPNHNLPGIDLDVELMRETALRLGFEDRAIRVLRNQQATHDGVLAALESHLGQAGEGDRVLFYFTGHGTGVRDTSGDENDDQDEALVLHDYAAGGKGLLVDDEIARILKRTNAAQVLMFVDACHSGTIYKSFGPDDGFPLGPGVRAHHKGIPGPDGGSVDGFASSRGYTVAAREPSSEGDRAGAGGSDAIPRLVAYTAAKDHQSAIATEEGSVFTLGIHAAIRDATGAGAPAIRYEDLQSQVANWVSQRSFDFEPSLYKDRAAPRSGIRLASSSEEPGPGWRKLEELADRAPDLRVSASKKRYHFQEFLELTMNVPEAGYLNVLAVDGTDKTVVLFPNEFQPDNRVEAGRMLFPGPEASFDVPAMPPAGKTLIVVFWTKKDVNLHEKSFGRRDKAGHLVQELGNEVALTKSMTRSWGVVARDESPSGPKVRAGKVLTLTVPRP